MDVTIMSVLLLVSIQIIGSRSDCQAENNCPPEKRFCTPVGCVYQCPENSFQNGTVCVFSCGDWFVVNNTCMNICPSSMPLTIESISVFSGTFIKFRRCVNSCKDFDSELLEYGGKCEHQCPSVAQFILENSCVKTCPRTKPFIEVHRINKYVCVAKCSTYQLRDEFKCVSKCPNGTHIFNQTCVDVCPAIAPYSREDCKNCNSWSESRCHEQCPKSTIPLNFSCLETCPNFYFNNECVLTCPVGTVIKDTVCYDECPLDTRLNGTECTHCDLLDKGICVEKCPHYRPYNENRTCVEKCSFSKIEYDLTCIDQADCNRSIHYNGQCLESCPEGMYWYYQDTMCREKSGLYEMLIPSLAGIFVVILFGFLCLRIEPWGICCTYKRKWNAYEKLPKEERRNGMICCLLWASVITRRQAVYRWTKTQNDTYV